MTFPKKVTFLITLLTSLAVNPSAASSATLSSWACIGAYYVGHILDSHVRCVKTQMEQMYHAMTDANCKYCDKYFHCMANYNAVHHCGNIADVKEAAKAISDCREAGDHSQDSKDDQAANLYGRNSGDCASRYLCNENCKYNPHDKMCQSSNCP